MISRRYRVEVRNGCTLIFGALTLPGMSKLASEAPRDAVHSPVLCQLTGASMAYGSSEAVKRLTDALQRQSREESAQNVGIATMLNDVLSAGAQRWLLAGEACPASATIFTRLTAVMHPALRGEKSPVHHPTTAAAIRRCRLLLESSQELPFFFSSIMSTVSEPWARLVKHWPSLGEQMDLEYPQWRDRQDEPFYRKTSGYLSLLLSDCNGVLDAEPLRRTA